MIHRPKQIIDPRLVKKSKDPTFKAIKVDDNLVPIILSELVSNCALTITRAMNYAKIIYNQLYRIPLHDLLNHLDPSNRNHLNSIIFFGSIDPSTFRLYTYWYSRFLHHILLVKYNDKYVLVSDIDIEVIKSYLFMECRRGLQPGTVRTQLSSIKHMLHPFSKQFTFLYDQDISLKKLMTLLYKMYGRPINKKSPITYFLLYKILGNIKFTMLVDVRDWSILIISQVSGMRGASVSGIKWTNMAVDKYTDTYTGKDMNIIIIFLEHTKTENQSSGATVTIACPNQIDSFNVMVILLQYIRLLRRDNYLNDYLFPSLKIQDRSKNKHINTRTISKIVKKRIKQIGEDPSRYGAHSGRQAFVQDAVAAGIPPELIKKTGLWKSDCWYGYFHDTQYAQARATSRLQQFGRDMYATEKSSKKSKKLLKVLMNPI